MEESKNQTVKVFVIIFLLILTLPLFYMLFARVLLPMAWDEPQFKQEQNQSTEAPATE